MNHTTGPSLVKNNDEWHSRKDYRKEESPGREPIPNIEHNVVGTTPSAPPMSQESWSFFRSSFS